MYQVHVSDTTATMVTCTHRAIYRAIYCTVLSHLTYHLQFQIKGYLGMALPLLPKLQPQPRTHLQSEVLERGVRSTHLRALSLSLSLSLSLVVSSFQHGLKC